MPLVNAKCTNCGANLQVDNTKDAAICQYCGSAYIVEKAINNYNTVNHIHASVVNIYGGNSADFVIRGGVLEKYNGASTNVTIPNSVRCIGPSAFRNTLIESVDIPNSVKSIGGCAFYNCEELKSIVIPNGVTKIGEHAFDGCNSLTSIYIPSSLQVIETHFRYCPQLTDIKFEDTETKDRFYRYFPNYPDTLEESRRWSQQIEEEREKLIKTKQSNEWRDRGLCNICGGTFKGIVTKKCSKCGKIKQY